MDDPVYFQDSDVIEIEDESNEIGIENEDKVRSWKFIIRAIAITVIVFSTFFVYRTASWRRFLSQFDVEPYEDDDCESDSVLDPKDLNSDNQAGNINSASNEKDDKKDNGYKKDKGSHPVEKENKDEHEKDESDNDDEKKDGGSITKDPPLPNKNSDESNEDDKSNGGSAGPVAPISEPEEDPKPVNNGAEEINGDKKEEEKVINNGANGAFNNDESKVEESSESESELDDDEDEGVDINESKPIPNPSGTHVKLYIDKEEGRIFINSNIFNKFFLNESVDKVSSFCMSKDYKKAAYCEVTGKSSVIVIRDFDELSIDRIKGDRNYDVCLSPDGKKIIYRKSDWKTLYIFDLESRRETKLEIPLDSHKYTPKFFPDGHRIAFVTLRKKQYEIIVCDINDTKNYKRIYKCPRRVTDLAISPDGRYIAFSTDHLIRVAAVNDKERRRKGGFKFGMPLPLPADLIDTFGNTVYRRFYEKPLWSPDGSILYFSLRRSINSDSPYSVQFTSFGREKYEELFKKYVEYEYIGNIESFPVKRTKEIVGNVLDEMITRIEDNVIIRDVADDMIAKIEEDNIFTDVNIEEKHKTISKNIGTF